MDESFKMWERMEKSCKQKNPSEFLSTHPASKNRILKIKKWIPEVRNKYQI